MGAIRDARPRAGRRPLIGPSLGRPAGPGFALAGRAGDPAELVVPPPGRGGRRAMLVWPDRRALVLGSAQQEAAADPAACAAAGVAVVRRRSGGGAVLVGPGEQVWLDLFVPAGDPLLEADVSRSAWWLGELWAAALDDAGRPGGAIHRGPLLPGERGRLACFAGLGPGEVTLAGRKLVGISQRRDRTGAWLFSMACLPPPAGAAPLPGLLRLDDAGREGLAAELAASTTLLDVSPGALEDALAARLALLPPVPG